MNISAIVAQHSGFIVDVPVTLTVAVRGEGITSAQAKRIAELYAESLTQTAVTPAAWNTAQHRSNTFPAHTAVTEASLEHPLEKNSEILEELDPEPDSVTGYRLCVSSYTAAKDVRDQLAVRGIPAVVSGSGERYIVEYSAKIPQSFPHLSA